MSGMTFEQMRARVEAQYGRDPEDDEDDERPVAAVKRRAKPSIYADNERAPSTQQADEDGAWNDVLCDILMANTRDTPDERLVNIVRNDKTVHAAEWSTLDHERVPVPRPAPSTKLTAAVAVAKPKTLYDDVLAEYADVVPPRQQAMFRSAEAPDEPDTPESRDAYNNNNNPQFRAPYSVENETPPIASLLSFLRVSVRSLPAAERPSITRAILRHQQRLLLTEPAEMTRKRNGLIIFERSVKTRFGGRYNIAEWRRDLVGKWAGSEILVSASNEHVMLEKMFEELLGASRAYVDIYHLDDALYVYCVYAHTQPAALGRVSAAVNQTEEQRDPSQYAAFRGLMPIDQRPYIFEGFMVTQSLQSHEQDVNAAEIYGN